MSREEIKGAPPAIPLVLRERDLHANGRVGQVHRHFAPRAFPLGRQGYG